LIGKERRRRRTRRHDLQVGSEGREVGDIPGAQRFEFLGVEGGHRVGGLHIVRGLRFRSTDRDLLDLQVDRTLPLGSGIRLFRRIRRDRSGFGIYRLSDSLRFFCRRQRCGENRDSETEPDEKG
jgi:hypothetical protein